MQELVVSYGKSWSDSRRISLGKWILLTEDGSFFQSQISSYYIVAARKLRIPNWSVLNSRIKPQIGIKDCIFRICRDDDLNDVRSIKNLMERINKMISQTAVTGIILEIRNRYQHSRGQSHRTIQRLIRTFLLFTLDT
jgi:hypothetical protein